MISSTKLAACLHKAIERSTEMKCQTYQMNGFNYRGNKACKVIDGEKLKAELMGIIAMLECIDE